MATLTAQGVRFGTNDILTSKREIFPQGTAWVFCQASAPTGWTKSTGHDNKALRVVSGNGGGSAGTNVFTTTMSSFNYAGNVVASTATGDTQLAETQIPSHIHVTTGTNLYKLLANSPITNPDGTTVGWSGGDVARPVGGAVGSWIRRTGGNFTSPAGGNGNHSHPVSASAPISVPISIATQYVDVIVCTFDG